MGVFGMDIQFTQSELSDYLNDVFWIELLKTFGAGNTYFILSEKMHLEDSTGIS